MFGTIVNIAAWMWTLYVLFGFIFFLVQRKFIYKGIKPGRSAAELGLDQVREIELTADDGKKLKAWYAKAKPGMPTLLYFHGNFCNLSNRKERIQKITRQGYGLFMLSFRGYGLSEGVPSEHRNLKDAAMAYDYLRDEGIGTDDIVIYGESLGTGVATQTAAAKKVGGLVLEAPYSSLEDLAKLQYPMFPVSDFLADKFESIKYIGKVEAPKLIIHAYNDEVIPFELGKKLFAAASEPKEFVSMEDVGHYGIFRAGAWGLIRKFIETNVQGIGRVQMPILSRLERTNGIKIAVPFSHIRSHKNINLQ